jgi:Putative zinc-finger
MYEVVIIMLAESSNCNQVKPLLDAFLDKELDKDENKVVSAHLADCKKCQIKLDETRLLVDKVNHLSRLTLPRSLDCDWDTLIAQKIEQKSAVSLFKGSATVWTAAALAASVILLLLVQRLFVQFTDTTVASHSQVHGFGVDEVRQNVALINDKRTEGISGAHESLKEHLTAPYEDLLAADPAESSSFSEEVGISTDEDGLYALKL